jgi:hypothetical protein
MRFQTGELAFTASVTEAHDEPSTQTGAPLKWLTIQFRAQTDEAHEQALAAATERSRGGLFSVSETADRADLEWRVADSSVQFVGNPPWGVNHHTWVIQQVERVACSRLRLGALELEPYDYAEDLSADSILRLVARCTASDSQLLQLLTVWGEREPLEVTRVGISDQPRRMRVEDYVWGPGAHGQGVVVLLADVAEPRVRLANASAPDSELLRDLLALLHVRNVLSADDLKQLKLDRHNQRRVADIDAWEL